jgi:3-oxoacyl-[acyl-carrier-protein] synthase-3
VTVMRSAVRGVGGYLPPRIVTNAELSETVDTSDAWIRERTGIQQRHRVGEGRWSARVAPPPISI